LAPAAFEARSYISAARQLTTHRSPNH